MAPPAQRFDHAFITGFVAGVASRLAFPTDVLPSVRCVSRPVLVKLLLSVRDELAVAGHKQVSATALLGVLRDAGIAHIVPLDERAGNVRKDRLYAIGFGGTSTELDPVELLQAHEPSGVVCYFTALAMLSLTTQLPAHHHIAILVSEGLATIPRVTIPPPDPLAGESHIGESSAPPALGSKAFAYQGIPYYTTRREAHRVVGVQTRYVNAKSRCRVTTVEQSLLDSLHRPHNCGGPAVVFEAWGAGSETLDAMRLVALLRTIDDSRITRRAGYMLSQFAPALVNAVHELLPHHRPFAGEELIPLLAGIPHTSIDHAWGVGVP